MKESEMEDLLWSYPDKFLYEPLTQFRRQARSSVGRADLIFVDRLGRLLVVELKKGKLERGAVAQLFDYFGMLKREFPDKPVEMMVIANSIPQERVLACNLHDMECREISEKKFRDVAGEVGYEFESEKPVRSENRVSPAPGPVLANSRGRKVRGTKIEKGWYYSRSAFEHPVFLAFVNAKGSCSMRVFDADDGSFLGRHYAAGDHRDSFREYLQSATPVTVSRQPNLEKECRERLPSVVLAELQRQRGHQ